MNDGHDDFQDNVPDEPATDTFPNQPLTDTSRDQPLTGYTLPGDGPITSPLSDSPTTGYTLPGHPVNTGDFGFSTRKTIPKSTWSRPVHFYHKLEVLSARQINRFSLINLMLWCFCIGYMLTCTIMCNIPLGYKWVSVKLGGRVFHLRKVDYEGFIFLPYFECSLMLIMCVAIWTITIIFGLRVFRNNTQQFTKEQVWVFVMLLFSSLAMNPITYVWYIHDFIYQAGDLLAPRNPALWISSPVFDKTMSVVWSLRIGGGAVASLFYLWALAHTYGLPGSLTRKESLRFYTAKLIPVSLYQILIFIGNYKFKLVFSPTPFVSFIAMIRFGLVLNRWEKGVVSIVCSMASLEFYMVSAIIIRVITTTKYLKELDYTRTRSKQIGFRFFVYSNVTCYVLMIITDIIAAAANPQYRAIAFLYAYSKEYLLLPTAGQLPAQMLQLVNLLLTAYIHLPCDAQGFLGWFKPTSQNDSVLKEEPLSLSVLEDGCSDGVFDLWVHSRSLVLETHISMLNFSWLAYTWGKRHSDDNVPMNFPSDYGIPEHIQDEKTDTKLLIISNTDRIIIAFKGTTSVENLRTDANIDMESISKVLPSTSQSDSQSQVALNTPEWKSARIHEGFGAAYASVGKIIVSKTQVLRESKKRPVLLCGHSLGGALATICSLDLRLSLNLKENDIFVSTFGSPRVGNFAWGRLYENHVPIHWRFTNEGDVVTMLPKSRYKHVGKRVLITSVGDLFMDPNSLEGISWMGEVPSVAPHKKQSYMKGIGAFCTKYVQEFYPLFWDFKTKNNIATRTSFDLNN